MLKKMGRRLAAALWLVAGMGVAQASALSDAAASLQPGQWTVLNKAGDASGFNFDLITACGDDCGDVVLNYTDKGLWNPLTRELHFIGKGHMRELKHLSYSEATNKWAREADPYWTCHAPWGSCYGMIHGYEHTSINPLTGDIFARIANSTELYKWTRASKTWSKLPAAPLKSVVALGIEYFPELGGLVLAGGGEVHLLQDSTNTWTQLAQGLSMGPYHNVARYNPVQKVVLFGGGNGSRQLYKLDAAGKVTAIAAAPANVGIMASVFMADPASGKYLLFGENGDFYEYDVVKNSWGALSTANVPMFSSESNRIRWRVGIPVSTYGLIAFLAEGGDTNTRVLLYRHASGQATTIDTTPPSPPPSVSVK